jgi:hypothetical protein
MPDQNANTFPAASAFGNGVGGSVLGLIAGKFRLFSTDLFQPLNLQVITSTVDVTLDDYKAGSVCTNRGATGAVQFTLPPAVVGLHYIFVVKATQQLRINPDGTQTIALPATGAQQAAGKYIWADALGERIHIACLEEGKWDAIHHAGTWTAEA